MFNFFLQLRENAKEVESVINQVKDILSYIHFSGLPPAKLTSSDKSIQVWTVVKYKRMCKVDILNIKAYLRAVKDTFLLIPPS